MLPRRLDPENRLLVMLLRVSLGTSTLVECEGIIAENQIDWGRFEMLAVEHRVVSLVFEGLSSLARNGGIPKEFWKRFSAVHRRLQLGQLAKVRDLLEIAKAFEAEGIRYLTLKGPALSQFLLGDAAKRHCNDLDFVVLKDDFSKAVDVVNQLGFEKSQEAIDLRAEKGEDIDDLTHHSEFVKGKSRLELHWRLSSVDQFMPEPVDRIFERREHLVMGGLEIPMLGAEDLAAYLTLHGSSHCWHRLKWIYDLAVLEHKNPVGGFPRALERAWLWRVQLLRRVLGVPSKQEVKTGLLSRVLVYLCQGQIFGKRNGPDSAKAVISRSLALFLCTVGVRNKMKYLYTVFSWSEFYGRFPLPKPLRFLYCVLGPVYWVWVRCATKR